MVTNRRVARCRAHVEILAKVQRVYFWPQSLESAAPPKVLKFSAKTRALTKMQKAEHHHGFSPVLEVNPTFKG